MRIHLITSTWDSIVQYFFPVFTLPSSQIFKSLVTGWILCTGRRTVTGIYPFADPDRARAHDAYHRFLRKGRWDMAVLWKMLAVLLVKTLCRRSIIHLDADDTLYHHCGYKVNGAGWFRDAVRSGTRLVFAHGLNLIVVTVRIYPLWGGEPLALPITMRLHRKSGPKPCQLLEEMLRELVSWLPEKRFITHFDGFYASLADTAIDPVIYVSRMRRRAIIYDLVGPRKPHTRGRNRKRGKRLPYPEELASQIKDYKLVTTVERGVKRKRLVWCKKVIWYNMSKRPVLMVISRDPAGKEKDDFFFTTDLTAKPQDVISGFAGRWAIEDTFKNTKQLLGGQEPQSFKDKGPQRGAAMSFWLYSAVWLWYLRRKNWQTGLEKLPWYPGKRHPSFANALTSLRRTLWQQRIKIIFENSPVHQKIPEFLIAAICKAA
jgi:hypothetical protein